MFPSPILTTVRMQCVNWHSCISVLESWTELDPKWGSSAQILVQARKLFSSEQKTENQTQVCQKATLKTSI